MYTRMVVFVEYAFFLVNLMITQSMVHLRFAFQKLEKAIGSSLKHPGYINAHEQSEYHKHSIRSAEDFLYNYIHPNQGLTVELIKQGRKI